MAKKIENFFVNIKHPLRGVLNCIDKNAKNIALVVDEDKRLIETLTDGDIRRAILEGMKLDSTVSDLLKNRQKPQKKPITAKVSSSNIELLNLMKENNVRQIPLIGPNTTVVDLITLEDLINEDKNQIEAIIMAGGYGTRLKPLTDNIPKPLLPLGDQPILQIILDNLKKSGITDINISTHYKQDKISDHFGDGIEQGLNINYVSEEQPLGTAGSIKHKKNSKNPILVLNGDILTNMDFKTMLSFHIEQNSDLTVAVRQYDFQVPYGVLDCKGTKVINITEKPVYSFFVNAGIYMIETEITDYIPKNVKYDMTDLIDDALKANRNVTSFPIVEYWLDIGQPEDYKKAQEDVINKMI